MCSRTLSNSSGVQTALWKGDAVPNIVGCSDGDGDEDTVAMDGVDNVVAVLFFVGVYVVTIERVVRILCHRSGGRGERKKIWTEA